MISRNGMGCDNVEGLLWNLMGLRVCFVLVSGFTKFLCSTKYFHRLSLGLVI